MCFPEVRWIGILDVLPRGPKIEFWTCFPEVHGFEFGRASQRSDRLKFGRASQRSDGFESWTSFPEVQRLNFGRASQRSDGLKFGRASQRSDGLSYEMKDIKGSKFPMMFPPSMHYLKIKYWRSFLISLLPSSH